MRKFKTYTAYSLLTIAFLAPVDASATNALDTQMGTTNLSLAVQGNPKINITADGATVGLGSSSPASELQIGGEAQVGNSGANCTTANAGALRWNGTTFLGCNGSAWQPLSGSNSNTISASYGGHTYNVQTAISCFGEGGWTDIWYLNAISTANHYTGAPVGPIFYYGNVGNVIAAGYNTNGSLVGVDGGGNCPSSISVMTQ